MGCKAIVQAKEVVKSIKLLGPGYNVTTMYKYPYKMFAANFQPSYPSRPKTKGSLLFYFLKLYNFGFYEIFVGSTGSELQHPWISKIRCEPKKSRKNHFSGSNLKCF